MAFTVIYAATASTAPFDPPWGNYALEGFVEPHAPSAISWLPQTPGWLFVAVIVLGAIIVKLIRAYQRYLANKYRRDAQQLLLKISVQQDHSLDDQIPALLKKVAIQGYGRAQVAGLSGAAWGQWLDNECTKTTFSQSKGSLLAELSYSSAAKLSDDERDSLLSEVSCWIKNHRGQND